MISGGVVREKIAETRRDEQVVGENHVRIVGRHCGSGDRPGFPWSDTRFYDRRGHENGGIATVP